MTMRLHCLTNVEEEINCNIMLELAVYPKGLSVLKQEPDFQNCSAIVFIGNVEIT